MDRVGQLWIRGRHWALLGRYDRAFAVWASAGVAGDPRIHASRASALRQLGLHARAEAEDGAGLERAPDPVTLASLRIGLVADAVGRGDEVEARRRLVEAEAAVGVLPAGREEDRQRRRAGWVRAEVQMLGGEPVDVPLPVRHPAGRVVRPAVYRGAGRHHLAKGLLFSGVAHADRRGLDVAARIAWPGLRWAVHLARADAGAPGALAAARAGWAQVVVPADLSGEVAQTGPARRLAPHL